jgi:tetrapyrrole methylase family protein/MazG family protein
MLLARQKAESVMGDLKGRNATEDFVVVAADTIVVIDGEILGKPVDKTDSYAMLKKLSGKRHTVFTGVAIYRRNSRKSFYERTEVEFRRLTDSEINDYIETGEPFDKAGAYGIQGKGMLLVKGISGDFYNVMGLPISRLSYELRFEASAEPTSPSEFYPKKSYGINDLLDIMARLRVECPWDREQNHSTIRSNVIEEAYEVAEAIDSGNPSMLCEELGDLLLQVVFHGEIAKEAGEYDFNGICDVICNKLIYRHPHVFGDSSADSTDKVLKNWDKLKSDSKGESTITDRLNSVPKLLPALMRGEKVGKRASVFDFANVDETLQCLKSEIKELELAILHKNEIEIEKEFGDVLYSCCNLGRFLKKDCEKALTISINQFIMRFGRLESAVLNMGKKIEEIDREQLDELWQIAKKSDQSSSV